MPGAISTTAFGLNNNDVITGRYRDPADMAHGFVLDGGVYTTVDYPGAVYTSISAINDAGELVGFWEGADQVGHGFLATPVPEPGSIALTVSMAGAGLLFRKRRRK